MAAVREFRPQSIPSAGGVGVSVMVTPGAAGKNRRLTIEEVRMRKESIPRKAELT